MTDPKARADYLAELEERRRNEREQRRLAAEGIAILTEYGPEIGVRLVATEESHMPTAVYEQASHRLTLQVTPSGVKRLAEAVRSVATTKDGDQ